MLPSPIIDRFWFRSIYFREPSGVLFEIATLGPGFSLDEDPEHLGESLVLPPAFEHLRAQIEPILTPLEAPASASAHRAGHIRPGGEAGLAPTVTRSLRGLLLALAGAVWKTGKRDAEKRLTEVEQQHDDLEIRALPSTTRDRYLDEWRQAESRFVSDPNDAVRAADRIVLRVLEERGYPTDGDLDNRTAHVAADYPEAVYRYRHAHEMVSDADQSTESLRKAMVDLRVVFEELLERERAAV